MKLSIAFPKNDKIHFHLVKVALYLVKKVFSEGKTSNLKLVLAKREANLKHWTYYYHFSSSDKKTQI